MFRREEKVVSDCHLVLMEVCRYSTLRERRVWCWPLAKTLARFATTIVARPFSASTFLFSGRSRSAALVILVSFRATNVTVFLAWLIVHSCSTLRSMTPDAIWHKCSSSPSRVRLPMDRVPQNAPQPSEGKSYYTRAKNVENRTNRCSLVFTRIAKLRLFGCAEFPMPTKLPPFS